MSNIQRRGGTLPAVSTDTLQALEEASTRAIAAFAGATNGGSVIAALEVAKGIEDLRAIMDQPEIRARVQALQDTPLGFRTDRGPGAKNRKTGEPLTPYEWPIVRDAAIEAGLRGIQLVGNQFNIISSRFYGTKEGFEYLIRKMTSVTDFRPVVGVPQTKPGGVLIECKASWNQSGKPFSIEVTIPIKSDDYSTADQLIGKATRKLLARCYSIMTGNTLPEGDAGDDVPISIEATATTVSKPAFKPTAATSAHASNTTVTTPASSVISTTAAEPAPTAPTEPPQDRLAAIVVGAGITWDQFAPFLEHHKYSTGDGTGFSGLPDAVAARLLRAPDRTIAAVREFIQPA